MSAKSVLGIFVVMQPIVRDEGKPTHPCRAKWPGNRNTLAKVTQVCKLGRVCSGGFCKCAALPQ